LALGARASNNSVTLSQLIWGAYTVTQFDNKSKTNSDEELMPEKDSSNMLDITPHPRILQVFKDIEFSMLHCFCELIDNAVDGFLDASRAGQKLEEPLVTIAASGETIRVIDNGPGMKLDRLEKAVKAGWTSKNGTDSLGLYGIGFNIATARLGECTEIWTTTSGDTHWYGLKIDINEIAKKDKFVLPIQTRHKSLPDDSGTEIVITQVKSDWRTKLTGQHFKNNVFNRLSRIYKSMLRSSEPYPIHFTLRVNGKNVPALEHCVWPDSKHVFAKSSHEEIRAIQYVDMSFGKRYRSKLTSEMFSSLDDVPEGEETVEVTERVYGWLGIQRYLDDEDYGIDIIRNGRVIELASKDLFSWSEDNGKVEKEYPIDDPRNRGRIVGELHLDHGLVFYTKNKFEHDHSSWTQLLLAARSNERLTKRKNNYTEPQNTSPLGKLHRAFRRSSPQYPTTYTEILVIKDNEKAKSGVEKYRIGDVIYRDEKWWDDLLAESDRVNEPPSSSQPREMNVFGGPSLTEPESPVMEVPTLESEGNSTVASGGILNPNGVLSVPTVGASREPKAQEPKRIRIPELDTRISSIGVNDRSYEMHVYEVEQDVTDAPFRGKPTTRGTYEVEVNRAHPVFQSASFQVEDAVLTELAYYVTREEQALVGSGQGKQVEFGAILAAIHKQRGLRNSLEPNTLVMDIEKLLRRLQATLTRNLSESDQAALIDRLSLDSQKRIKLARAQGEMRRSVTSLLDIHDFATLFENSPELLMDTGCFKDEWSPDSLEQDPLLLGEYRSDLKRRVAGLLYAVSGFHPQREAFKKGSSSLYVRTAINMLEESLL
jgi:hypothetical protein